ncbi:hypothetical protein HYDPIDRAFT_30647 [Hydnomerulius pinastri MD-312]|uniref:Fungal-type protein kinase domain-containing protein n=1 Tax=Hydnomerulius pinastri MD-312 TaxID=994086 RepID=A0A0C9VVH2_9AGAM|nr:hypothetical protein HYDPIDRAFT_30647 [Hydnomerulius pinastri MD-312]
MKTVLELQSEDCPRVRNAPMVLVTTKLLPITDLHGEALLVAFRQCVLRTFLTYLAARLSHQALYFLDHHELWNAGMHDWDISCENLMYYEQDGKIIGVLNDFDLAPLPSEDGTRCPRGNKRPGTLPFMAIDLLIPEGQAGQTAHLYRHDLESFIWVLTWISLQFSNGVRLKNGVLNKWMKMNTIEAWNVKGGFLRSFRRHTPPAGNEGIWVVAQYCLHVLARRIRQLDQLVDDLGFARRKHSDEATKLGQKLTEYDAAPPATVLREFADALGLRVEQ